MNAAFCVPVVPIRILPVSAATPALAIVTLFEPVVRFAPAAEPSAMLLLPVVLLMSAWKPKAWLSWPVVFL